MFRNKITKNEVIRIKMRLCPSSIVKVVLKKVKKKRGPRGRSRLILYCGAHKLLNFCICIGNKVEAFRGTMMR